MVDRVGVRDRASYIRVVRSDCQPWCRISGELTPPGTVINTVILTFNIVIMLILITNILVRQIPYKTLYTRQLPYMISIVVRQLPYFIPYLV